MERRLVIAGLAAFTLILATMWAVPVSPAPARAAAPSPTAAPTPIPTPAWAVSGPSLEGPDLARSRASRVRQRTGPLRFPVAGATLPAEPALLPGSERSYRGGQHEGVDFPADAGTPVLAAADGFVLRADVAFSDWEVREREEALAEAIALGHTPERILDRIRGRQVWIDHGRGVVTRYAHLQDVTTTVGAYLFAGEAIGTVGSSGYPEGGPHLHFEIRVGDGYYGQDLAPDEQRALLERAFVAP